MRIIAGSLRYKNIIFPKGKDVRPTQSRVREALFNIINPSISGCRVLDLYAGSGSLAFEALSRGANEAFLIEKSSRCVKIINKNISSLGIGNRVKVFQQDALVALEILNKKKEIFDLIFIDPPYHKDLAKKTLNKLYPYDILSSNNIIIVEHSIRDSMPQEAGTIVRFARKKYGNTELSFYRKEIGGQLRSVID